MVLFMYVEPKHIQIQHKNISKYSYNLRKTGIKKNYILGDPAVISPPRAGFGPPTSAAIEHLCIL